MLELIGALGVLLVAENGKKYLLTHSESFTHWDPLFKKYAKKYRVPWRWLKAIAWNESDLGQYPSVRTGILHPENIKDSISSDGKSWGLMQVTLTTANRLRPGTSARDLNNPEISVDLAAKLLQQLILQFNGDREKVIRAYNGGPNFANTVLGQRDTPIYYERFLDHLAAIVAKQPGDEMEIE